MSDAIEIIPVEKKHYPEIFENNARAFYDGRRGNGFFRTIASASTSFAGSSPAAPPLG